MSVKFLPCQPEHLSAFNFGEHGDMGGIAQRKELAAYARTMEVDGDVAACYGITPLWNGVGMAWAFISDRAREHGPALSFSVAKGLFHMEHLAHFHRIEASVRCDFDVASSWLERLGFEYEGVGRRRDPDGSDHLLYARVS